MILASALAALLPAGPAAAQTAVPYVNTMRLVAATTAVPAPALCQVADGWLYTLDNGSFRVVDLADPVAPVVHGQLDGLGTVADFVVAGSRAYLARGTTGLTVLDLADRAHPQVAGTLVLPAPVAAVALYGPLVAVAGGSTFTLVDAADPQAMTAVGSGSTIAVADLAIVGDYALVTGTAGIATVALADPAAPLQVALFDASFTSLSMSPEFGAIAADGDRLAVRSSQWVLELQGLGEVPVLRPYVVILDASQPEALVCLAGTALDPYVEHITQVFRGDRVILSADGDLQAFDSATMQARGLVPGPAILGAAAWGDRFLYAARGSSLAVYDLAYPETVLPFATWGEDFNHQGGSARYDLATRLTWSGTLSSLAYRLYDVTDPLAPRLRVEGALSGSYDTGSPAVGSVSSQGEHVLLSTYDGYSWSLLSILDLAADPVVSAGLPYPNATGTISGHIVWVRTDDGILVAVDFSALPTLQARGEVALPAGRLVVQDEGACLLGSAPNSLTLLGLADPDAPQVQGTVALPGAPSGVLFRGGLAYVLCAGAGLQVIDLSDPQAPVVGGMLTTGLEGVAIAATDDRAVIANASGFQILSLAAAAHPLILSPVVGVPELAGCPVLKDDRAYAGHAKGMDVFNIVDPAVPVYLGSATGVQGRACDGGGWIILPGGACPLDDVTALLVDDDPVTVPAAMVPFRVAPNPFNPRTTVSFALDRPHEVEITVYDVRGAKLRTLVTGNWAAGEHTVTWDGCRDDGRPLASGPYVVRMCGDGGAVTGSAKVTLVR
ncbi:MAG: FlgD immunoglobulin-like domain containing protein [Candidatus Krumholzibacteriia bacterium]